MKKILLMVLSVLMVLNLTSGCFANDSDAWKSNTGTVDLDGMSVTGNGISVSGNVISISAGGDFEVTGALADGMIYVKTEEKVKLRLSGASITNSKGPAIFFDNAEKGLITITENTENFLADGKEYSTEDADAALFSNDDLEIKGSGKLTVTGNYKHGIASDDDMSIENGVITVNSYEHGIKVNNTLSVVGGEITVNTETGKGMKAEEELIIDAGVLNITTEQDEGIESKGKLTVNGGEINITAGEDGINTGSSSTSSDEGTVTVTEGNTQMPEPPQDGERPGMPGNGEMPQGENLRGGRGGRGGMNGSGMMPPGNGEMPENMPQPPQGERPEMPENGEMPQRGPGMGMGGGFEMVDEETAAAHAVTINGGKIYINAAGDGIDSNGDLIINGGEIIIDGPVSDGDGAIDYAGAFEINGGTVMVASSAGMLQINQSGEQNVIKTVFNENMPAGTVVAVKDGDDEVMSFTPAKDFRAVVVSSPGLETDKEYAILINGEAYETVKVQSGVTSVGSAQGGFGGGRGQRPGRDEIKVFVKGKQVSFDSQPVIKNDTTLVGFRAIFEALGASVGWDESTKTVTATRDDTEIVLKIGSYDVTVNGETSSLLAAPEIINSSTMVPVRFISEQLGMKVGWDEATKEITVDE